MLDRGKLLEKKIRQSGMALQDLAKALGITRQTLYKWFDKPDLHQKYFRQVGEIIGYSFAKDLPELAHEAHNDLAIYNKDVDASCLKILQERDKYLSMYLKIQEDLNKSNKDLLELTRTYRQLEIQHQILKQKIG